MCGIKLLFCVFLLQYLCQMSQAQEQEFSYDTESATGPKNWPGICNTGTNQSPVNILTESAVIQNRVYPLLISQWYELPSTMTLKNTGTHLQLTFTYDSGLTPTLFHSAVGGDRFVLLHMQFHFGENNVTGGSEHQLDGTTFDAEVELVFQNTKYSSVAEASNNANGIAIVSRFLTQSTEGDFSEQLCDSWSSLLVNVVSANGSALTITGRPWTFSLSDILGNPFFSFYSYKGSFTQPGCLESVTWLIGKLPLHVPYGYMQKLRSLFGASASGMMAPNNRPIQPLGDRQVNFWDIPYFP